MDYFARAYVINLPERTDRRQWMQTMLTSRGLPEQPGRVEFFPAIRPRSAGAFPSIGALGCYLSHLGVLRQALADGLPNVLVMEDDLEISPTLATDAGPVLDVLRSESWGMTYFGHALTTEPEPKSNRPLRFFDESVLLAHFYAVNGPVLAPLIDFLETVKERPGGHPEGGPMHVDGAFITFRQQHPEVKTLVAWPNLGWQGRSRSDISPRWFDRFPLTRGLGRLARSVKNRLKPR
jgi:hypothetical protein